MQLKGIDIDSCLNFFSDQLKQNWREIATYFQGHPIALTEIDRDGIANGFAELTTLRRVDKAPQFESPNPIVLVMKKM